MADVDFTRWTDAQLRVGARFNSKAQAELDRRQAAGENDGSDQRVAEFVARNRRRTVREN